MFSWHKHCKGQLAVTGMQTCLAVNAGPGAAEGQSGGRHDPAPVPVTNPNTGPGSAVTLHWHPPAASHGVLLSIVYLNISSWMPAVWIHVGWWFSGCLLISEREAFFPQCLLCKSIAKLCATSFTFFWASICPKPPAVAITDKIYRTWGEDEERQEGGGIQLSLHMRPIDRNAQAVAYKCCRLKLLNFLVAQYTA